MGTQGQQAHHRSDFKTISLRKKTSVMYKDNIVSKHIGCLVHFDNKWNAIISDLNIMEYLKGYKIPFSKKVRQIILPHQKKIISLRGERDNASDFLFLGVDAIFSM